MESETKSSETPEVVDEVSSVPIVSHTQPSPGEVVISLSTGNTYTIGNQIGEGNFGVVYGCVDTWENHLAAKVLKPYASYEDVRAAAENEVGKLLRLRHPYVTFVHDAFEYRNSFYIVTELCSFPLTDLFKIVNFDGSSLVRPIARCLLQAVHYLHVNNYAHQDIHLGNVFGTFIKGEIPPGSGEPPQSLQFKLGDLGITKLFHELDARNTRANWMLPPEVLDSDRNGPVDQRADIYHAGLLLLQVACSKELTFNVEEIIAGRPRELALGLPAPYNFALEKALRRRVAYRTATAMELWRDLNSPVHSQA